MSYPSNSDSVAHTMKWRPCARYPEYEISEWGDLRRVVLSRTRSVGDRPRGFIDADGYLRYTVKANGLALQIAGLRTVVTEAGGDWSQLKALIKAQVQDEQADDPKRVDRILEKADYAKIYADMLGLGRPNMNEQNYSADEVEPSSPEPNVPTASGVPVTEAAEQPVREEPTGGHTRVATHTHEKFSADLAASVRQATATVGETAHHTGGEDEVSPDVVDTHGTIGTIGTTTTAQSGLRSDAARPSESAVGTGAPISQADPDKPAEVETSAAPVAPGKRRWTFTDKAHADCLNPEQCGGFSNLGLCTNCKTAAGAAA